MKNMVVATKALMFFLTGFLLGLAGLWFFGNVNLKTRADGRTKDFRWGATINPYPIIAEKKGTIGQVLDLAQNLGLNTVRLSAQTIKPNGKVIVDEVLAQAKQRKIDVVLILDPPEGFQNVKADSGYKQGFAFAQDLAKHYRGKVKYYQLSNEPGGNSIKKDWSGLTQDGYENGKYNIVIAWLKGVADAIGAEDPLAQRIITGHWLQVGFIERAIADGLKFEILGWDWFNEQTPITQLTDGGKPFDLIGKLASFGKPLWLMEAGLNGLKFSEDQRADYLKNFAQTIYQRSEFSGFFAFTLIDEGHLLGSDGEKNGLVELLGDFNKGFSIGEPKPSYDVFQDLIKKSR